MKRLVFILLFVPVVFAQAQTSRKKISLDENWKFHLGHAADAVKDFNYTLVNIHAKNGRAESTAIQPSFNDSDWRTLNVPHDWAVELPVEEAKNEDVMSHGYHPVGGLYPQNSIGWYRKKFMLAKADSGQRYSVQFDGVFRNAKVWLNGYYLGQNESGYVGFNYDVTDYLSYGKDNVLVVRVDASLYEGWFYEGAGIYRHVWLNEYSNVHIAPDGIFAYADLKGNEATTTIETTIDNQSLVSSQCSMQSYITDRKGKKLAESMSQSISLAINEKKTIKQSITLSDVKRWSLEDPYLYKIVTVIKQGDKVIDLVKTRFGFRTVEISATSGVILNGKKVKLQGVNCHQDHAGVGSALPDYLQYYRIRLLKEMGTNAYRTSHNAPTPELLDACDSLGMLVLDETRLLSSSPEYMDQFERIIVRDRNHPSVFLWSIGNEEGYIQWNSVGKRIALAMLAKQKELDPTRTSTYAADLGNVFHGVNEVIPVRGFNYREKFVVPYHHDHPDQPTVGTEMGSTVTTRGIYKVDSVKGYLPDQDISAPWWASTAEAWWPIAANNEWFIGGFIWTGFDYRGEPTPFSWPNINSHFGVMDMCGFPKNIYYYYQSWWSAKDVIHISPHWNWKGSEGKNIDVWVNSNAEEVELFLNGKSQGKKAMPRNGHLQWSVPFKAGKLEAVGVRGGRKIKTSVETTSVPYQLVLTPDRTILTADGRDATVINVTVKDKSGREVPDANMLVNFSTTGDSRIIGVGNGDPSCHEPDRILSGDYKRSLFNGKCQLIVQAGTKPESLKVEATSPALQKASVTIEVKN